ncbi:MAG: hypothetical protein CO092_04120 [Candidatus Aenigmarchaeota archaeon CG_4_9_14_3_um_filter_37_18]|nr:MAG: hypothetical protein AUJ50_04820 [Candidatus Aenigmarchaeota archaeon CG1_02_38_14]PIV68987.1 MAG: hypothetical protein COS07_02285 [Candidatus Aenigmarchaeota archaeon CG01_land_8_20_14_3_00_37_9]PIY35527.1 MAG: hypothetical protein COZ04_03115 [Candidatus Aenigmarchaeota archaeon CG_4_10_14_3_um_filter_37_21]PJB74647.1 MAG: hypothetical protein CO092_04120 [Candidatus Aenigmarchaeota archaeon CG_4_9_14_3_um_filter_37_18]
MMIRKQGTKTAQIECAMIGIKKIQKVCCTIIARLGDVKDNLYMIFSTRGFVRKKTVKRFIARVKKKIWKYNRDRISFDKLMESVGSWEAYLYHADTHSLKRSLHEKYFGGLCKMPHESISKPFKKTSLICTICFKNSRNPINLLINLAKSLFITNFVIYIESKKLRKNTAQRLNLGVCSCLMSELHSGGYLDASSS